MTRLALLGVIVVLAILQSSYARASALPWEGTVRSEFGLFGSISITGAGVATIDASVGGLPDAIRFDGMVDGYSVVPVTDPAVSGTVKSVVFSAESGPLVGTIGPISPFGALQDDVVPVPAAWKLCLMFIGCTQGLRLPLTGQSGAVGVGAGGLVTAGGAGAIRVSLEGNPWTIHTATITIPTTGGGAVTFTTRGYVSNANGTTGSTSRLGGVLQLVTPMRVDSIGVPAVPQSFGAFNALTVRFVPEPSRLMLLGSGAIFLLIARSLRERQSSRRGSRASTRRFG